jgi:membrane protease YdiL (CAAX protease family)
MRPYYLTEKTMTTREKIATFITSPFTIISVISVSFALSVITSNIGTLFGFVFVLFTLWAIKWDWSYFGIQRNSFVKTFLKSIFYTLLIILVNDVFFQPAIELFFGETDLAALDGIKGNIVNYLIFLLIMWVVAAFGEEFLYRGYMTKRLAIAFGNTQKAWAVAILVSSVVFGFAHLYQGISGVISTGFVAIIFGVIFYRNPKNLWVGILTHGIYDVFGITMIFFDKERVITNWAQENIFFFY